MNTGNTSTTDYTTRQAGESVDPAQPMYPNNAERRWLLVTCPVCGRTGSPMPVRMRGSREGQGLVMHTLAGAGCFIAGPVQCFVPGDQFDAALAEAERLADQGK